jgi:hypothetical protein
MLTTSEAPRIDTAQLAKALQAADAAVLLIPARILRRVIKQDRSLTTLGLQVPHPKSYVIGREALLQIADPVELEVEAGRALPEALILIAQPEPVKLAQLPVGEALVKFWRRLFHARVHLALEQSFKEAQVTEAAVRQRIQRVGQAEFNEVRSVLQQENYLLPPADDRGAYVEFAAVYLELRFFVAPMLPHYFPSLPRGGEIDALLAEDVDGAALFAATRPPGAPDPAELSAGQLHDAEEEAEAALVPPPSPAGPPLSDADYQAVLRRAEGADARGNNVRAAVTLMRAAAGRPEAAEAARKELDRLVSRLQPALGLSGPEAAAWRRALAPLLPAAAQGYWSVERRMLYDLQKVCLDHERGVYAVDAVRWLLSLGRHALRRPLPALRQVGAVKRLRKAAQRLGTARLGEEDRERLAGLLGAALARSEARLRAACRPPLAAALEQVGLVPANVPEEVARDKLTEELLDRVVAAGYLTMGDLRDALSRNQLKLPELGGAPPPPPASLTDSWVRVAAGCRTAWCRFRDASRELLFGDPLLRLDRELGPALDGVYHRGEFYLRWLQRLSSVAFGTRVGRFLTRYLVVPFGGAYVLLGGLDEIFGHVLRKHVGWEVDLASVDLRKIPALEVAAKVGVVGALLLLLLYVAPFRRAVGHGFWLVGRGLRGLFFDLPRAFLRVPLVRAVVDSRPAVFFRRYLLAPLVLAGLAAEGSLLAGLDPNSAAVLGGSLFVVALVFCTSRVGRDLGEALTDWVARGWRRLSVDIIPGLFRLIMEFFKALLELVSRFLYTIDEWLRFRSGESPLKQAVKAVAGVFWFFITYVVRFAVNVLIEPQINPIKHFPIVTVSHKLLLFVIPVLQGVLEARMNWGPAFALLVATSIIWSIPGIFGFMAWELKENWFLYKANRPSDLRPAVIGGHGETMLRLLRRGFHSGTVPKLHARLRKAEYRGRAPVARKQMAALHHVAEGVRHFAERELVSLLAKSRSWGGLPLEVGQVVLASSRAKVELRCPALPGGPVWLVFDEQQGWLLAGVGEAGWLAALESTQRRALAVALAGLYKMAAVMLVREQIRACLRGACCGYDLTRESLVVWTDPGYEAEVVYDLRAGPVLRPRPTVGVPSVALPTLAADRLLFGDVPVAWAEWVAVWQRDRAGAGLPEQLLPGVHVLPPRPGPNCPPG